MFTKSISTREHFSSYMVRVVEVRGKVDECGTGITDLGRRPTSQRPPEDDSVRLSNEEEHLFFYIKYILHQVHH